MSRRVIRWEDPRPPQRPAHRAGRPADSSWNSVAEELRQDPRRRWGVVFEGDRTTAMNARNRIAEGRTACFRPYGDFEARVRSMDGVYVTFARYIGEEMSA